MLYVNYTILENFNYMKENTNNGLKPELRKMRIVITITQMLKSNLIILLMICLKNLIRMGVVLLIVQK
jgi:hypothetical protein